MLVASETSFLVDMSKNPIQPRDKMIALKEKDPRNTSFIKVVYNARYKCRVLEQDGGLQMQ